MAEKKKPTCYIIAGPNGSGKTTFALNYLPEIADCHNFVNADLIAYGISPLDSLSVQYDAGRLFLNEVHKNIDKRIDFAFETTLAGRSQINLLKKLRKDDWQIVLFFLWIRINATRPFTKIHPINGHCHIIAFSHLKTIIEIH